jgi:phospholipid-transporting ATPase
LVVAKRIIEEKEYVEWAEKYLQATSSIYQREEKMDVLQDEIEKDFELIAATAIEDKLQPDVGITIEYLKQAGIKYLIFFFILCILYYIISKKKKKRFWMLTGDKIETAINIGYSCKLINDIQNKIIIDAHDAILVEKQINESIQQIQEHQLIASLIVSGDALINALKDNLAQKVFIYLLNNYIFPKSC